MNKSFPQVPLIGDNKCTDHRSTKSHRCGLDPRLVTFLGNHGLGSWGAAGAQARTLR